MPHNPPHTPPHPGRKNPEPDTPAGVPPLDDEDEKTPGDDEDVEKRRPGRD
jgi:hypothetical protein